MDRNGSIPVKVKRIWDAWDLRLLVLLSLAIQIILSLSGNRRKYVSSLWFSILVWASYLIANSVATIALGKLSDTRVDHDTSNTLQAIWAPLLLLHLGGPDTITAYSLEDNHLWMRHLYGLVVQLSIAVYVIIMSWKHSWFSIMSIPALVAGFIKYGERTWVFRSASQDKFGHIVPFGDLGDGSNLGSNNTSEDENYLRVLYVAHKCVKEFKSYMLDYDLKDDFPLYSPQQVNDINLFWKAIEVEIGLMFDLFYTKAPINFSKGGWILRCLTSVCTVTVLIGLTFELISTGEDREKWHKVDIAITVVLVVGALALEIYGAIALYLFSDWAMLWLIKHNRGKELIQLRKKNSWLFLPKQYQCNMIGQFDLIDFCLQSIEADKTLINRILRLLWRMDQSEYMFDKYVHKTAVVVNSLLLNPILDCCQRLTSDGSLIPDDWMGFSEDDVNLLDMRILRYHIATEVCYNLELEWDTHDDASENNRESIVSEPTTPPSGSSSSWEENRKLCRTLSRYMMYIIIMRPSLLPAAALDKENLDVLKERLRGIIGDFSALTYSGEGTPDVRATCRQLLVIFENDIGHMVEHLKSKQKKERWELAKSAWVRILCDTAIKCHRYEHLRQLSQGGEFLTFLWFFIPQTQILSSQKRKNSGENSEQEP